jgi:ribosomal protein S18 acetylase RimI-like enzyme
MVLTIRPFDERDEAAVVALWSAAFPHQSPRNDPQAIIRQKRRAQPELFLVGEVEGRAVATVLAGYDGHRGWVYHVAVAADARRRGHGGAMMAAAADRLRALGCPKINLQINRSNAEAVAFYEALGYAVEDRISMGKVLS